jgi:transposase InsO family protein
MCALMEVSRAGFYRPGATPRAEEVKLRDHLQRVALEWPTYGSRRITAELRRSGWRVNRKRVQRLMRKDNLLCLRKRQFVVTTDSAHGCRVYPNLAASLAVNTINQLWMANITYNQRFMRPQRTQVASRYLFYRTRTVRDSVHRAGQNQLGFIDFFESSPSK